MYYVPVSAQADGGSGTGRFDFDHRLGSKLIPNWAPRDVDE
jgi:hypothetical protein